MNSITLNVAANGAAATAQTGNFSYFYCRNLTTPVQVSFDGTAWFNLNLNDNLGPINPTPTRVWFRSIVGLASSVTFDYSNTPIAAQSVAQKVASTYAISSVKVLGTVGGAWQAIPSGDGGHQRKHLLLTLDATAGAGVAVIAVLGSNIIFTQVTISTPFIFETDASFQCYGTGAAVGKNLYVGEIYYNA